MSEQKEVYSFAWYSPEEWQKLKDIVSDPDSLDESYEDWRKAASNSIAQMREQGMEVVKISVKITELIEWCSSRGKEPDSEQRAEFAAYKIQKKYE